MKYIQFPLLEILEQGDWGDPACYIRSGIVEVQWSSVSTTGDGSRSCKEDGWRCKDTHEADETYS